MSIGMLRAISFEWMEKCIWSEQAPGEGPALGIVGSNTNGPALGVVGTDTNCPALGNVDIDTSA